MGIAVIIIYTRVTCVQYGGFTCKTQAKQKNKKTKQNKQKHKHACKILLQQLHEAYITRKMHAFSIVGNFSLYFYTQAAYFF